MNTARGDPERSQKQRLLRLRRPEPAMGLSQIRHFHLPVLRRRSPWSWCSHLVCPIHLDGRL